MRYLWKHSRAATRFQFKFNVIFMPQLFYFSRGNHKLSRNILIWDLPHKSTCPGADKCLKYCYARKAEYLFKYALQSRKRNYVFSLKRYFVPAITDYLRESTVKYIRVHSSGDFYSKAYFLKWVQIAKNCSDKVFFGYTKSLKFIDFSVLPNNFKLLQSYGGLFDDLIDPAFSTSRVIESKSELWLNEVLCTSTDPGFKGCGLSCSLCMQDKIHLAILKH